MLQTSFDCRVDRCKASSARLDQSCLDLPANLIGHPLVNILVHQCLSEASQYRLDVLSRQHLVPRYRLESRRQASEKGLSRVARLRVWIDRVKLYLFITVIKALKHFIVTSEVFLHLCLQIDASGRLVLIHIDSLHCFGIDLI